MSSSELYEELRQSLLSINVQIGHVRKEAQRMKVSAYDLKDMTGSFMLSPLLVAKANILNGLAVLKGMEKE